MRTKDDNTGAIIGCAAYFILLPFTALLNGYALSMLWQWFVVSTFEARPIGILPAIGIAMVAGFLTKQYNSSDPDPSKSHSTRMAELIAYTVLNPLFALVFGWIVHSLM